MRANYTKITLLFIYIKKKEDIFSNKSPQQYQTHNNILNEI